MISFPLWDIVVIFFGGTFHFQGKFHFLRNRLRHHLKNIQDISTSVFNERQISLHSVEQDPLYYPPAQQSPIEQAPFDFPHAQQFPLQHYFIP